MIDYVFVGLIIMVNFIFGYQFGKYVERSKWNELIEAGVIPNPTTKVQVDSVVTVVYSQCVKCGKLYPISCPCRKPGDELDGNVEGGNEREG